jgi:hypothetical protein
VLILASVLHYFPYDIASEIVGQYVHTMAPGSYILISCGTAEPSTGAELIATYDAATLYNHSPEEMTSFFQGLFLIPPGVCEASNWGLGGQESPTELDAYILVGVGRKP